MPHADFQDSRPAPTPREDGSPDPYAEFRVERSSEAAALLKRLVDGAVPVQLSNPQGAHLNATLWALDAGQRRLSFGVEADHPMVQRLAEGDEATAVAYLEAIKLQFELDGLHLVRGPAGAALQAAMPRRLYRFQRRQSFRVRTLAHSAPTARLRHPSMPEMTLELRVLDVSAGGCALLLPHDVPPIAMGLRLRPVRMDLDDSTGFDTALLLHHASTMSGAAQGVRLGCEFAELSAPAERALQRYIDATQKRRRLMALN